jgi:hypothetical protein
VGSGEVGDEGGESLGDLELYVDTLPNDVVHCLDDGWDRKEDGCRRGKQESRAVGERFEEQGEGLKRLSDSDSEPIVNRADKLPRVCLISLNKTNSGEVVCRSRLRSALSDHMLRMLPNVRVRSDNLSVERGLGWCACLCIPCVYPLADARPVTLSHNILLQYALTNLPCISSIMATQRDPENNQIFLNACVPLMIACD